MQKVNLGVWYNPFTWFQKPQETAKIVGPGGQIIEVPIYAPTAEELPGYVPSDITSYAALTEYVPGRGYVAASVAPGATTGSWWESTLAFLTTGWGMYLNTLSQSAKDRIAMQLQQDMEMEKKPAVPVDWTAIAKTALMIGGIGLGVYLVVKKK